MNLSFVHQENQILRGKLMEISRENMILREEVHEIDRLRLMLGFQAEHPQKLVGSRVVGEIDARLGGGVLIDKGTESGLVRNMTVICPDGLIGRIMNVGESFATVKRIIDPGNRVSALLQRGRATGILQSRSDGSLLMEWVAPDADVAPGDTVISSGLGSILPKGILIGTVDGIGEKPERFSLSLQVCPAVDFERLEEVFVVVSPPPAFHPGWEELRSRGTSR
jgi:rod shape-determining protein MreC